MSPAEKPEKKKKPPKKKIAKNRKNLKKFHKSTFLAAARETLLP